MEKTESAVRSRLLEAGKEEFRDKGFLKASLRSICRKADVTTGALYFFFESKASLFEEIVEETAGSLEQIAGGFADPQKEKSMQPDEYDWLVINFIWENRDIARILINGAEGTKYENFWEDTCKKMEQLLQESFFKSYGKEADRDLIHILVEMKLQGYAELLNGDYSQEKFLKLSKMLRICSERGYQVIEEEIISAQ